MAGHSKFKNIMHRKGAQDKKRAKIFTKVLREITVASRSGLPDPQLNPRLRVAMIAAREVNMPKDKIENAIRKATSNEPDDQYEEIRYEGYGPCGTAFIVEALSNNRNRTASEVRSAFSKYGGNLGESGSVSYMFKHIGLITYPLANTNYDALFETALNIGANDLMIEEQEIEIITDIESFHLVKDHVEKVYGEPLRALIDWKPINYINLDLESMQKVIKFIDSLEESDDVQNVVGNFMITDELLNKMELLNKIK